MYAAAQLLHLSPQVLHPNGVTLFRDVFLQVYVRAAAQLLQQHYSTQLVAANFFHGDGWKLEN